MHRRATPAATPPMIGLKRKNGQRARTKGQPVEQVIRGTEGEGKKQGGKDGIR
jgi:hypothetical protein